MMSRMDPMRARKWQDEVAGTCLVTRKFSSSIFCWKNYTNLRRAGVRTPRISHGYYNLVLLAKVSPLPFIATRGLTEENP
jgi:hypothetical protein